MLINREREKLLQAIVFFATNVEKLGKTKLFKLLYFLDFEHYKVTGRSVTGLEYHAWKMGPVPIALDDEMSMPEEDMREVLSFNGVAVYNDTGAMQKVVAKVPPDLSHFTKRELAIMNSLAQKYKHSIAKRMIEDTHFENLPWHQVYHVEENKKGRIPYKLSFLKQEYDDMKMIVQDRLEAVEKLS